MNTISELPQPFTKDSGVVQQYKEFFNLYGSYVIPNTTYGARFLLVCALSFYIIVVYSSLRPQNAWASNKRHRVNKTPDFGPNHRWPIFRERLLFSTNIYRIFATCILWRVFCQRRQYSNCITWRLRTAGLISILLNVWVTPKKLRNAPDWTGYQNPSSWLWPLTNNRLR